MAKKQPVSRGRSKAVAAPHIRKLRIPIGLDEALRRPVSTAKLVKPFEIAQHPPIAIPNGQAMAMDEFPGSSWAGGIAGLVEEGQAFLGYPELSLLAQRAEYRRASEVTATEMTRKWIDIVATGGEDGDTDEETA